MPLNQPDIKELKAIVDWANLKEDVRELSLKYGDIELLVTRNGASAPAAGLPAPTAAPVPLAAAPAPAAVAAPAAAPAPAAPAAAPIPPAAPAAGGGLAADEIEVTAPMVGTFYAAPQPGAPAFVQVGDRVAPDSVLCIVEVMKLMSNIEAGVSGTVSKILVENEQAVEFGQALFVIKKDA